MGFNKCFVPEIDELIQILKENGLKLFVWRFSKCNCYIGSSESIEFIKKIISEYES